MKNCDCFACKGGFPQDCFEQIRQQLSYSRFRELLWLMILFFGVAFIVVSTFAEKDQRAVAERLDRLADWIEDGKPLPGPRRTCRCGRQYHTLDGHVCVR